MVGGSCLTVSSAGGWLMGGGLSALSRKYGYGVDNVVEFQIVLPNGTVAVVDACSQPDLWWALRGGGGGTFGVVTRARYRLHPKEQVTMLHVSITYTNDQEFGPLLYSFWTKWVEWSPNLPNGWGGYFTLSELILYYTGDPDDAQPFIDVVQAWKQDDLGGNSLVDVSTETHESYWASKNYGESGTDATGSKDFFVATRLIPLDMVQNDPSAAVQLLTDLSDNGYFTFNYYLGGATLADEDEDDDDDDRGAMNPAARRAVWMIATFGTSEAESDRMIEIARTATPGSGSGYNHGSKKEPDWTTAFWGDRNYERLLALKEEVDPLHRLNAWHTVGCVAVVVVVVVVGGSERRTGVRNVK